MGTERPSCTLYDTLSNINTSDHKLQPGGKVSRDPSPRPAMTAKSEQNRDGSHEEDWRRDREREKMRDKARGKDQDPRDRYYEKDRAPAQWPREGEREWRERERRQEDDRRRHARPLSNVKKEDEREVERGMKKGDTFPRMRKNSGNHGRQITVTTEQDEDRGERRKRERPKRIQADDWEREMERYKVMERDEMQSRAKEERQNTERRPLDDEKSRQRQRYQELDVSFQERRRKRDDSWDRKERDAATKREKLRPDMGRPRLPSPHRQRDREIYAERVERDKVRRRERQRDARSEGDIDEREMRRERQWDRERDELQYHHSRSDGDSRGKRERDKQGYREEDRQRYRDRDREREVVRSRKREVEKDREKYREVHRRVAGEADSVRERCKENMRDVKDDRRRYERYKESRQGGGRETNKRELDHKWGDSTGRGTQSQSETAPRVPPRAQSSGEWSTAESDRDIDEYRSEELATERRENEQQRIDRQDRDREEMSEHRRMWLEPQRGKNGKDAFSERERHTKERNMEPQTEWGREHNRVKEEPDQYDLDQSSYRERHRGRNESSGDTYTEGVSVDGEKLSDICGETDKGGKERLSDSDGGIEKSRWSEAEGENVTDIIDGSDREEECGSDYWARSESEGGSDTGWQQERDRMLSGEDGFVTVSSGVDEEDDREEDEEEFEDCQEFLDSAVLNNDPSTEPFKGDKEREEDWRMGKAEIDEDDQGREKQPKYVFCVIGQTLPREKSLPEVDPAKGAETDISSLKGHRHDGDDTRWEQQDGQIINNQDTESKSGCNNSQEETEVDIKLETGDAISHGMEHPYDEIGPINRDSQTEKLLMEWREKNKEEMERKRDQPLQVPNNPYADVYSQEDFEQIQPILDRIDTGAMSPEEVEAIRIRLSRAWTMSEQPKQHSQAPHLKWAKNVVREILGNSEEQIVDETDVEMQKDKRSNQFETIVKNDDQEVDIIQKSDGQVPKLRADEHDSDPELEEDESLEVEGLRGMGQGQADMHAEQFTAMHGDTSTHTHADTLLDTDGKETDPSIPLESEKADIVVEVCEKAEDENKIETEKLKSKKEVEMYLSVSNTLYKPNSCPILSYETESDLLVPSRQDESQEVENRMVESEEERQEEESEQGTAEEVGSVGEGEESEVDSREMSEKKNKRGTLMSSCSFRDLGPEARIRRRGIRKTTERGNGEHVSVKEEEGVARDRRTRIFSTTDDEDDRSKSWGEVELRNVLDTIERRKRNSRFFNAAQLYQQYSEAAQNFEILRQARSDVVSASEDATPSPAPSPPPARRPLPPLPTVKHPHSLPNAGSISSVQSLPLPEPPKTERRASSPRLSLSLSQSATLWRELPAVRNSSELGELTEDQRRLQEVRFEVVTSEASYCRSLDIVVEHFVKSKQLGALLGTQDRNWLFSRLADVRAISHSFLSKLEERMESNIMSFTVCDVIARNCQRFKMVYVPYLTNQSYQDATYQRLMNENPGFKMIVEKLERSPLCQRLPLRSFLVLPFQRITRLKLLVQNIVKRTSPGTPEATQAIKALKLLEKLIQESNDSITQMRSIESLVSLSAKVDFECRTLPLISQSRRMIREGPVIELIDFSLKDTERNIYLHLFNDYLLISLQKEGGRFTVIDHSPVSDLRVENCRVKLHSLQKNLFRLHMSNKALLLRTDTLSDKLRWISALSRPHPEIDFSTAQEFPQMQCIRAFVAQQPDELSLEKADIILVHQESSDHWVEGTRLPDQQRGWVPESHLETISNSRVRQRNLSDALKLTTATAAV